MSPPHMVEQTANLAQLMIGQFSWNVRVLPASTDENPGPHPLTELQMLVYETINVQQVKAPLRAGLAPEVDIQTVQVPTMQVRMVLNEADAHRLGTQLRGEKPVDTPPKPTIVRV